MFASDSSFFFAAAGDEDDDPEPLSFTDGEASQGEERPAVLDLRRHIGAYLGSRDAEPLNVFVDDLYEKIEDAIERCGRSARRRPERVAFFSTSVGLYEAALDALDLLTDSLLIGSNDGVERGRLAFEAAVAEVDRHDASVVRQRASVS